MPAHLTFICTKSALSPLLLVHVDIATRILLPFFLYCPKYAALRINLLASAAHIVSQGIWDRLIDKRKVDLFLYGNDSLTIEQNKFLFHHVHQ